MTKRPGDDYNTVSFDKEKLESFRREYRGAIFDSKKEFEFESETYITEFAKHLIEYLENKFKNQ